METMMESVILIVILALQTLVIIILSISVTMFLKRGRRALDDVQPKIQKILDDASSVVNTSRPISNQLVEISINLKEISRMAREATHDVGRTVEEAAHRSRLQIRRMDGAMTDAVDRTERAVGMLTRNVTDPLVEISAIIRGVRTGVQCFQHLRHDR
jgi:biopolymer transport protein ExbB/TolQ